MTDRYSYRPYQIQGPEQADVPPCLWCLTPHQPIGGIGIGNTGDSRSVALPERSAECGSERRLPIQLAYVFIHNTYWLVLRIHGTFNALY